MIDETLGFFSSMRAGINLSNEKQTGTYFSSETGELQKEASNLFHLGSRY